MSASTIRFLQQENIRLKRDNELLNQEKLSLQGYIETIKWLYWAEHRMISEENLIEFLGKLLYRVKNEIGAKDCSLSYLNPKEEKLTFVVVHGDLRQQLTGHSIEADVGIAGWVVENHQSIFVNNPRQDWRFSLTIDEKFAFYTGSILSVPVMYRNGLIGIIQFLNKGDNNFTEADVGLALVLSQVLSAVLIELPPNFEVEKIKEEEFVLEPFNG